MNTPRIEDVEIDQVVTPEMQDFQHVQAPPGQTFEFGMPEMPIMNNQNRYTAFLDQNRQRYFRGAATMDLTQSKKLADRVKSDHNRNEFGLLKEAQSKKLSLSDYLETLDPSPTDIYGNVASPLNALERLHFALGINLRTITIEQYAGGIGLQLMVGTVNEWIRQGVERGMGALAPFAIDNRNASITVHPLNLEGVGGFGDAARAPVETEAGKRLGAGPPFPTTHLQYRDKTISLGDYGRNVQIDEKVIATAMMQEMRIPYFFIGVQIAYDDKGNIFEIIDNGDGVTDGASGRLAISGSGGAGALTMDDLNTAWSRMWEAGLVTTHWCGEGDSVRDFLNLAQFTGANFRDETLAFIYNQRGPVQTPLGMLFACPSPPADADHLAFFDGEAALARAENKALQVEADKLIQNLTELHTVSGRWAFYKLMLDASGMIDYSA